VEKMVGEAIGEAHPVQIELLGGIIEIEIGVAIEIENNES